MGIIRKQSIYSSIFIYIGFLIGALNILILFPNPNFFTPAEFGLTRVLIDISLLFATLCTIGAIPVTLKFSPFYNHYLSKKENDLSTITITLCILGSLLFIIATYFLKDFLIRKFGKQSPLLVEYFYLIYPITLSYTFFMLLESYAWSMKQTVISNFSKEVLFRVSTTLLIILYITGLISIDTFLNLFSLVYFPSLALLFFFIWKKKGINLSFHVSMVTKRLYKKIASYAILLFSGSVLNITSKTIDTIIIASQSAGGLTDAAIFTIPTYLVTIMDVPQRSIISIATPVISEAWKDRNIKKIEEIYRKTSLNLLIIGLALGGAIFLNMDNAILFLGDTYKPIKNIALVMGIAKLIDLGTGLNSTILLLSKYWRVDFITNMCFVVMAIPLNYFLIRNFGVMGAAYANFIALTLFNLIRFVYIYKLFNLFPFTSRTMVVVLIGVIIIAVLHFFLPFIGNIYADTIIRSFIYLSLFTLIIVKMEISNDINELVAIAVQKARRLFISK